MKTFFPPNARSEEENKETVEPLKMVLISNQIEDELLPDTLTISRQELLDIHKDLHHSLSDTVERLIHPINSRLDNYMAELRETTKKADTNAVSCVSLREELYTEKIRFRWSPSSDIIVYKNGTQLLASDVTTGKDLLKAYGIKISPEEDRLLAT
ncbi:UNVERIFIED_CONTAM: hypothetical protein K2H54_067711 [Gekko kuhli]